MKCLIMSDSHGSTEVITNVLEQASSDIDGVIHCGDSELSIDHPALKNVCVVRGNCDSSEFPEEILEKIQGISIYITHGHLYNVKMTYVPLSYRAEEREAQLVCFGHSHVPAAFEENGVVYVNPGSLLLPRQQLEKTYAIVDMTGTGPVTVSYYNADTGEEVSSLGKTFTLSK